MLIRVFFRQYRDDLPAYPGTYLGASPSPNKKGAATPEALPIVSCMPLAIARFPYLGLLTGPQEKGVPAAVYKPAATMKHPAKLASGLMLAMSRM
jgi:hypothetical protein